MTKWKLFRDATLIMILLILLVLIPSANPQIGNQIDRRIISDIVKNNFRVVWFEEINDIDKKVYRINISNLQDTNRDFNLTILMNNATFSLHQQAGISTQLFELKNVTGFELQPIYEQINLPCDFDITINCSIGNIIGFNNVSYNRIEWKSSKNQFLQRNAERYRENMGVILIPKKSAKDKNDGVVNATKQFMLEITNIPLKQLNDGWGNRIRLSIVDESTGNEYHPWSNLTFRRRQRIQVKNIGLANMTNYTIFLRVPYDSDMDINFKDLRFTYFNTTSDTETNLNYFRQNYTESNSADVWVGRFEIRNATDLSNNNASIYMYYKNNSFVESQSNGNLTFLYFAEGWNIYNSIVHWTNLSSRTSTANEDDYNFALGRLGYHNSPGGTNYGQKEARFNVSMFSSNDGLMARMNVGPEGMGAVECGPSGEESITSMAIENITSGHDSQGTPNTRAFVASIRDVCNDPSFILRFNCHSATANSCFSQQQLPLSDTNFGLGNFGYLDLLFSTKSKNVTAKWKEGNYQSVTNTSAMPWMKATRLHFSIGVLNTGQGTTNRMAPRWMFLKQHIQPEPAAVFQKEESTSGSKPLFYVNRTNWTLVRKNARVIHNINWTNNNSVAKLDRTVFETNITGTARNFTNLTNAYHAVKINITNATSSTGFYYWKSHAYVSDKENSTNRMFVLVDNVRPVLRIESVETDDITPVLNVIITDNLGLSHCWYNITTTTEPNTCWVPGSCPTYFSCSIDPILSGINNGASYRAWIAANDTSDNRNITRASITQINWTVNLASGVGGGSGGGGGIRTSTLITELELSCGTRIFSFLYYSKPNKFSRDTICRNEGKSNLNADLEITEKLAKYVKAEFCDIDGLKCSNNINLFSGESGLLRIKADIPRDFKFEDGFINIRSGSKVNQFGVEIAPNIGYGIIGFISDFTGISDIMAIWILFSFVLIVMVLLFYYGGI